MNNELMERYERAVADTNERCKLEEGAWLAIDKSTPFGRYSQFESIHNARTNWASREAALAREVKKRIEELEANWDRGINETSR
jgi:hypothetical protein